MDWLTEKVLYFQLKKLKNKNRDSQIQITVINIAKKGIMLETPSNSEHNQKKYEMLDALPNPRAVDQSPIFQNYINAYT